jgi:hypothetical protein
METTTNTNAQSVSASAPVSPTFGEQVLRQAAEADLYRDLGPTYAAVGTIGDLSLEIGFRTGEGDETQRSGIGFYLRSDHIAHRMLPCPV